MSICCGKHYTSNQEYFFSAKFIHKFCLILAGKCNCAIIPLHFEALLFCKRLHFNFYEKNPLVGLDLVLNKNTARLNFKRWTNTDKLMKFMDGLQSLEQFYMWNPISHQYGLLLKSIIVKTCLNEITKSISTTYSSKNIWNNENIFTHK